MIVRKANALLLSHKLQLAKAAYTPTKGESHPEKAHDNFKFIVTRENAFKQSLTFLTANLPQEFTSTIFPSTVYLRVCISLCAFFLLIVNRKFNIPKCTQKSTLFLVFFFFWFYFSLSYFFTVSLKNFSSFMAVFKTFNIFASPFYHTPPIEKKGKKTESTTRIE